MSSGGIPTPLSLTDTTTLPDDGRADTSMRPPSGVNLTALSSRLIRTWPRRSRSASTLGRSPGTSRVRVCLFPAAAGRATASACAATSRSDTGARSMRASPCSTAARSRRSSMRARSLSACRWMTRTNSAAVSGSRRPPSRSVSAYPLIAVSGVLSSCDTLATNSRLTLSSLFSSLTSWNTATAPTVSPDSLIEARLAWITLSWAPPRAISRVTGSSASRADSIASCSAGTRAVSSGRRPSTGGRARHGFQPARRAAGHDPADAGREHDREQGGHKNRPADLLLRLLHVGEGNRQPDDTARRIVRVDAGRDVQHVLREGSAVAHGAARPGAHRLDDLGAVGVVLNGKKRRAVEIRVPEHLS